MAIGPSTQEEIPRQYRKGRLHGAATITSAIYLWEIPLASTAVKKGGWSWDQLPKCRESEGWC